MWILLPVLTCVWSATSRVGVKIDAAKRALVISAFDIRARDVEVAAEQYVLFSVGQHAAWTSLDARSGAQRAALPIALIGFGAHAVSAQRFAYNRAAHVARKVGAPVRTVFELVPCSGGLGVALRGEHAPGQCHLGAQWPPPPSVPGRTLSTVAAAGREFTLEVPPPFDPEDTAPAAEAAALHRAVALLCEQHARLCVADANVAWLRAHARESLDALRARRRALRAHLELRAAAASAPPLRVVLGAGVAAAADPNFARWARTNVGEWDVRSAADFAAYAAAAGWRGGGGDGGGIAMILAEHVWEHLDHAEGLHAAQLCYAHLAVGGQLRIAVPDASRPGESDVAAAAADLRDGHRVRYRAATLRALLELAGFDVAVLEHHDEDGAPHIDASKWRPPNNSSAGGAVARSALLDARGAISLVVDARKPRASRRCSAPGALPRVAPRAPQRVRSGDAAAVALGIPVRSASFADATWEGRPHVVCAVLGEGGAVSCRELHRASCAAVSAPRRGGARAAARAPATCVLWFNATVRFTALGAHALEARAYDAEGLPCGPLAVARVEVVARAASDRDLGAVGDAGVRQAASGDRARAAPRVAPRVAPRAPEKKLCVLTIVLNGMPYLRHHVAQLDALDAAHDVEWEWHVVEGVAAGRASSAAPYSDVPLSGARGREFHSDGLSVDGTSQYLDALASDVRYRGRVFVHRPAQRGALWKDKIEMVDAGTSAIAEECVLLQLDADEIWSAAQLHVALQLFSAHPERECAYFDCHFFVTPTLVTTTRGGYGHNDAYEWLRMWRFRPGMRWHAHAPPALIVYDDAFAEAGAAKTAKTTAQWRALHREGGAQCFTHAETRAAGLVFTHYAYATIAQVRFKELFYGYPGAAAQWQRLRCATSDQPEAMCAAAEVAGGESVAALPVTLPVELAPHLRWVPAGTHADAPARSTIAPRVPVIAPPRAGGGGEAEAEARAEARAGGGATCGGGGGAHVVVDGAIFQVQASRPQGIWRVWSQLIPAIARALRARGARLTLLHRTSGVAAGHLRALAPAAWLDGTIALREVPPLDEHGDYDVDARMLARVCESIGADVFVSTLYTSPTREEFLRRSAAAAPGSAVPADTAAEASGARRAGLLRGTQRVLLVHDMLPELEGWKEAQWEQKTRAISDADLVVAVSETTARHVRRFHFGKGGGGDASVTVVRNRVGAEWAPAGAAAIAAFRAKLGVATNAAYLLVVGSRSGYKNAAVAYAALAASVRARSSASASYAAPAPPPLTLVLVGGGALSRSECEELRRLGLATCEAGSGEYASEHVVVLGLLSDAELRAAYSGALGLAHFSLHEGFGFPLLEAMACACPVVALDISGSALVEIGGRDALLLVRVERDDDDGGGGSGGGSALRVDPHRVQASFAALQTDAALRTRLVAAGLARVEAFRGWAGAGEAWANAIEALLAA
jgi:glycosyltransferase involved in cell wall biosynthesis/predicted SAM-dependent methyltransferase